MTTRRPGLPPCGPGGQLALAALAAFLLAAAAPSTTGQAERPTAEQAITDAWAELHALEGSGADLAADDSPIRKRALDLWMLGRRDPASAEGARATSEALRLLVRIGRTDEAVSKAESLGPEEPAWEALLEDLLSAARSAQDYDAFVRAVHARLGKLDDPEDRSRLWFILGRVYAEESQTLRARGAFQRVIEEVPGSALATQAEGMIYELRALGRGRPAPPFSAVTLA